MENSTENIFQTTIKESNSGLLLVDESLETRTAPICELLVAIDPDSIQLALKEKKSNRMLALEVFRLDPKTSEAKWTYNLEQLSRNSHLLRNYEFSKAIVGIFSNTYTLVPDAVFKQGDEEKYLQFNFKNSDNQQKFFSRHINSFHLHTVFGISKELHREIFHLFEEPEMLHLSSALLEAAQLQSRGKKEKALYLNIRKGTIDIIVFEGKKLLLMNTYATPSPDDLLYFTLLVCDQLELDQEAISIRICGEVEKESPAYKLLSQYFRNLQLLQRPSNLPFSYHFDKVPAHHHFSLFSLALCES
ncbi:MAG: DUF3822 family protein [Bacteroidia bacterium]|nr:DUF3822 family protein [Bacteroidia bacterium]